MVVGGCATAVLLYLLTHTSPVQAGAFGVLGVFILLYVVTVVGLSFLLFGFHRGLVKLLYADRAERLTAEFTLKKSYYLASVLALAPVIYISLRSVGRAGIGEVLLIVVLMVVGSIYIFRQTS